MGSKLRFWSLLHKKNIVLSIKIAILSSCNIIIGFLYQWYIITSLGAGSQTDALFAGMVVPQLILAISSGSLIFVLVPLLSTKDRFQQRRHAWTFFQGIGIIFFLVAFLLYISAAHWTKLLLPGFNEQTIVLTIKLVRIQLIGMLFVALLSVLWAINHANNHFMRVEITAIFANMIGFVLLMWGLKNVGIVVAAWAIVLKSALQVFFLINTLGPYYWPNFKDETIQKAWRKIRPLLMGTSYYKTDRLFDRYLASMSFSGGLSLLHLSQQLYSAGSTILNKAIVSPMIPELSRKAADENWSAFRIILYKRLGVILSITLLVTAGIISIGEPVLGLLFGHQQFNMDDVEILRWLLLAFSGMWIGGAAGQVLSSSFYASGETVTPTRIGTFGFTLGLIFKAVGFYFAGIIGIAIGTSLYYLINVILLYFFLEKHIKFNRDINKSYNA